jgi:predicted GNAT family acetyltransferase
MKVNLDDVQVINNRDARRFEAKIGDYFALIDYTPAGDNIIYSHTEVPAVFQGQGVAGKLARYALDYARDNDLKVVPLCPYVAAYIKRHPEYQPLVWNFPEGY